MRRKSQKTAQAAPSRSEFAPGGWLMLILAAPRILRLFYPEVWVEDDFYLESAYLVSAGMRPYLDFVHPHMPVLEFAVAPWLKLFGASHFSIELLNEAAIYLSSVLVFPVAARIAGRRAALCAALAYAFASLVFRYHVFERECFAGVALLGAVLVALGERALGGRRIALLATLMVLACAIKLTAAISCAIVLVYVAFARKEGGRAAAALAGAGLAAGLGALSALFYWLYGFEFIFQTYIFHFMKGRDTGAWLAAYPAQIFDLLAPLFVLGCVRIIGERLKNPALGLVLALIGANYAFFGWLSPTAWAHNYLDFLPYVAVVAGLGAERLLGAVAELIAGQSGQRGAEWLWAAGGGLLILVFIVTVTPLVNENWLRDSVYGFGFMPRDELRELAGALKAATLPEEEVIAPAFLSFEANRRELVRYPETYGVYREAREQYQRQGFLRARRELGRADFFGLIERTAHFWSDKMRQAVADGSVNAVVADSPLQLLPIVRPPLAPVSADFLLANGFRPALRTEHFVLWLRPRRGAATAQRLGGS